MSATNGSDATTAPDQEELSLETRLLDELVLGAQAGVVELAGLIASGQANQWSDFGGLVDLVCEMGDDNQRGALVDLLTNVLRQEPGEAKPLWQLKAVSLSRKLLAGQRPAPGKPAAPARGRKAEADEALGDDNVALFPAPQGSAS